jgi:hypothetical protein
MIVRRLRRPMTTPPALRWVKSIPAYELIFGDFDRAVDWVLSLRCVK